MQTSFQLQKVLPTRTTEITVYINPMSRISNYHIGLKTSLLEVTSFCFVEQISHGNFEVILFFF